MGVHYTIKQIAEEFQVHERTVMRWIRDGKLQAMRFGKSVRITEEEMNRIRREGIPRG